MVKLIELTQDQYTLVDDEDYEELSKTKWCAAWSGQTFTFYVMGRNKHGKTIRMHQLIMNPPKGFEVDHINRNPLDNRRCNLRLCTRSQNVMNQGKNSKNTSGYKGVCWKKGNDRWCARIGINNDRIHIGYFDTAEDAAIAYNFAALKYHGEFAQLNYFPSRNMMPRDEVEIEVVFVKAPGIIKRILNFFSRTD